MSVARPNLFLGNTPSRTPGGAGKSQVVDWPSPWMDYASWHLPQSMTQVLQWAEYIWLTNGTYRQACTRTARYFITDVMIKAQDDEIVSEMQDIFNNALKFTERLSFLGDNFLCYGNLFMILSMPFKRYLKAPGSLGIMVPFEVAEEQGYYDWADFEFKISSKGRKFLEAQAKERGIRFTHTEKWEVYDDHSTDVKELRLIVMNPHEVEVAYHELTGSKEFYWNINAFYQDKIKRGVSLILRETPMEIIRAVQKTKGRFKFDEDVMFHWSDPAPAGVYSGGWGLPRVISNFRLAFHYQVLNRYDQAIALDYINGIRVISPETGTNVSAGGDPIMGIGGTAFNQVIQDMLQVHRQDPATWHVSGFPLKYQLFGAEGGQLSPKDLMESKLNEWLDATGIPAELFHGNLSVQAAPLALRLFEQSWPELTALYRNVLEWVSNYMQRVLRLPEFEASMMPVKMADDLENKAMIMQMMASGQVAPQTGLQLIGINDPREEIRKVYEMERIRAEEEKQFQDEMEEAQNAELVKQDMLAKQQMQQGGAPMDPAAMGGAPMDPAAMGGGMPMGGAPQDATPQSRVEEADRHAQELVTMDATARRSTLINMKKTDPTLHALVSQRVEDLEQQAATAGVAAARQGQM